MLLLLWSLTTKQGAFSTDLTRYPQAFARLSDKVNFRDRHHIRRTRTKTQIEVYRKKWSVRGLRSDTSRPCQVMSVLDDFVRMRLYRERASEFELLAETEDSPDVRLRYRIVASHYRELVEREEKADKARMAELIERARLQRQQTASKAAI